MSDLIDRQAAIMHFVKASKNYECGMLDLEELTHELWQLPSVQPDMSGNIEWNLKPLDYIDRQAAIDAVGDVHPLDYNAMAVVERLRNLPSVQPQRMKGKWIKHENPRLGRCMRESWECSICGACLGCENFVRRSFCPNCGADMRGTE